MTREHVKYFQHPWENCKLKKVYFKCTVGSYIYLVLKYIDLIYQFLGSIVVSIPACHAGDRGSIPRRGDLIFFL